MLNKLIQKYKGFPKQVKAAFWFLICTFMQKGITVISTPIFTRLLSTTQYGYYSVFSSWLNIITIFVTLRLYYGVYTQGLVKFEEERDKYSSVMQGLLLALMVFWLGIYLIGRQYWNALFDLSTVHMLIMFSMMWTTAVFNFWAAEQRVKLNYLQLVIVTIGVSLAKPLVGVILVYFAEDKFTARIAGLAIVELFGYSWCFFAQVRRGKTLFSRYYWKYALMLNIPLVPHYLSQTVLNSADRIMIKQMIGPDEAGIYALAYAISQIMILFNQALLQTIAPWMYSKIKRNIAEETASVVYISLCLIAAVNLLLIALAPEAVSIFAPPSYRQAIWIIPPVAMSVFFIYMYGIFSHYEFYFEKTKFILLASLTSAVLNIVLNYIFIKRFGYYAAGYTTLVCYIVYALGHYIFMNIVIRDFLNKRQIYSWRLLLGITGVFMCTGFALLVTYKYPILRYSIVFLTLVVTLIKRNAIVGIVKELVKLRKGSN